jgi:hypothetical protein
MNPPKRRLAKIRKTGEVVHLINELYEGGWDYRCSCWLLKLDGSTDYDAKWEIPNYELSNLQPEGPQTNLT